jgi:aminoglycoside 6'-N-acetyltransferase Ib
MRSEIATTPVTLRRMTDDDLPMFHAWLQRPHVAQYWDAGDLTLEDVQATYRPRVMAANGVIPYIAQLDERPVGYAQSYVALGCGGGWWEDETDPGVRGIDQFLAEPDMLGQGVGTRLVLALVDMLFRDPAVTRIQTDPDPTNARAIRCYEKAGFMALRIIATPDGPALYMSRSR